MSDQEASACGVCTRVQTRVRSRWPAPLALLAAALTLAGSLGADAAAASFPLVARPPAVTPAAGPLGLLLAAAGQRRAGATVVGSITPGGPPVTVTFANSGDDARLTFSGSTGRRVFAAFANDSVNGGNCCYLRGWFVRPDGSQLTSPKPLDAGFPYLDTVTLPVDGPYDLRLDAGGKTGSVTVTLYDVPADPAPVVVPTPAGASVSLEVATPGQNMAPTFQGAAGQRISAAFADDTVGGGRCCNLTGSIVRPDGTRLASGELDAGSPFLDTVTLPVTGTYTVLADPAGAATGGVTLTVYDVPADPAPGLTYGVPQVLTAATPGQNLAPTFLGSAGQHVHLAFSGNTIGGGRCCNLRAQLRLGPKTVAGPTEIDAGAPYLAATLTADGLYTVLVDPQLSATGSVTVTLEGDPGPAALSYGPVVCRSGRGVHARSASVCLVDPVNSLTGAYTATATDLSLPGIGVPFVLTRSYTSADPTAGRLGSGWADAYSASLAVQANGDVLLHGEDGQEVYYTRLSDGSFAGAAGALSTLSASGAGYKLVRPDQVAYTFDSQGRLTDLRDRNGQGLVLAYSSAGLLTSVTDGAGRAIAFAYNASNLLARVTTPDGRSVSYGYAGNLLTSFTDPAGRTTTYAYDPAGRLATETDPNGHVVVQNAYGADGRVSDQRDALGNRTTFSWDPAAQTETVTDARGGVWKDVYANGVLARRIDPLGQATSYGYDGSLDQTALTGPDGSSVTLAYDARGNLTSAASAALHATRTIAYDGKNDVTSVTDANGKITTYAYDAAGNRTAIVQDGQTVAQYAFATNGLPVSATDGRGGKTIYGYDAAGDVVSATDPLGARTTFTYDAAGRLTARTDPLGNVTTFAYDQEGHLLAVTDPVGARTTYTYDAAGNRTSVTDAAGRRSTYAYDAADHLVSETAPDGGVTTYSYDAVGNQTGVTDPGGGTTTSTYDSANRLASRTSPLGEKTTYRYDANGNLVAVTDPAGQTTTNAYDAAGRLVSQTDPLGAVTAYGYDATGNRTSLTDPNGHTTTFTYDGLGRVVGVRAPDGGTTTYAYDAAGDEVTRTDPNGKVWSRAYDADGRLASSTTPLGEKTTYRYDAAGNQIVVTDPTGNATTSSYDAAGRAVAVTDPLGATATRTYDAVGNLKTSTDAKGHVTSYAYDAANRVVALTAPDGAVTRYRYDLEGNLVARTDANGHTTTLAYDADNRRVALTTALGRTWTYAYDPTGLLAAKVDANGNATPAAGDGTTTLAYDADGRLTSISYSDATPRATYVYDAAGNRTGMTDGSGSVAYSYDAANRLIAVTRGTDTFSYSYDPAGNVRQRTYPDGTVVSATYDDDGRLAGVTVGGRLTTYAYNAAGRLSQVAFPDGYVDTRAYDADGRLAETRTAKGTTVLGDYKVTRDLVGNPTLVVRSGTAPVTLSYGYDAADRLTSVCFKASCPKAGDPFVRWTYDAAGNRLTETRSTGTTAYSYDAGDELLSAGPVTYTYDRDGNELSAGGRTFAYDLAGRLISTTAGSVTTAYRYDGDGLRLTGPAGSLVWDVNASVPQLALERDASGSLLRRYAYGRQRISLATPAGAFYYHYDDAGSVTNVTSATGKSEWTELYEPFGAVRTETKNDPSAPANPLKFAGEYLEPTGLYDLRARRYDPTTGRFLGLDPLEQPPDRPLTAAYVYALDRPTVLADPTGMGPIRLEGAAAAAALAASAEDPDAARCLGWPCLMPVTLPPVNLRAAVVAAALQGWRRRDDVHYTQSSLRWQGIADNVYPPGVPAYADCSSFATWTYYVAGAPDPNGHGYDPRAAWTGTLGTHGASLGSTRAAQLARARPGDLVFYGPHLPWEHVAIYIGGGEVVSHGSEAGPLRLPVDYRSDRGDIRSYL